MGRFRVEAGQEIHLRVRGLGSSRGRYTLDLVVIPTPPSVVDPSNQPASTRFRVTFTSVEVSHLDDGWIAPFVSDSYLEVDWTFRVKGQAQVLRTDPLGIGVTRLGVTFLVDVPAESPVIDVVVSGIEDDPIWDDTLAGFTQVWTAAQGFGAGAQYGSASDGNITYRMNYTITRVP